MNPIQIAIDGPSGAGKSTMAKYISQNLGIMYLDTGAMYRAVALKALRLGLDTKNDEQITNLIPNVDVAINYDKGQKVFLDGEDVTHLIRTNEVSMGASDVSAFPKVREKLVELQQAIASNNSVVMDGRDIGTHVLPHAKIKIFLTASVHERAKRRFEELKQKGLLNKTFEELVKEIETRDYNDSNREASPLKRAEDAILVDTSELSEEESIYRIMEIIRTRLEEDVI